MNSLQTQDNRAHEHIKNLKIYNLNVYYIYIYKFKYVYFLKIYIKIKNIQDWLGTNLSHPSSIQKFFKPNFDSIRSKVNRNEQLICQ